MLSSFQGYRRYRLVGATAPWGAIASVIIALGCGTSKIDISPQTPFTILQPGDLAHPQDTFNARDHDLSRCSERIREEHWALTPIEFESAHMILKSMNASHDSLSKAMSRWLSIFDYDYIHTSYVEDRETSDVNAKINMPAGGAGVDRTTERTNIKLRAVFFVHYAQLTAEAMECACSGPFADAFPIKVRLFYGSSTTINIDRAHVSVGASGAVKNLSFGSSCSSQSIRVALEVRGKPKKFEIESPTSNNFLEELSTGNAFGAMSIVEGAFETPEVVATQEMLCRDLKARAFRLDKFWRGDKSHEGHF